jgi:hypothetical protein
MAWLALLLLAAVAFGGMALAFGWSERAEERRILAWADAVLARGSIVDMPPAGADADAATVRTAAAEVPAPPVVADRAAA